MRGDNEKELSARTLLGYACAGVGFFLLAVLLGESVLRAIAIAALILVPVSVGAFVMWRWR